jgi:hypothetical protein
VNGINTIWSDCSVNTIRKKGMIQLGIQGVETKKLNVKEN